MKFKPYDPSNAEGVLQMLSNHVDYTPETDAKNSEENIDYFNEVYIEERMSGIDFVLVDDSKSRHLGFLSAEKRRFENGTLCWYITSLFIAKDENADANAIKMVESFMASIHDAKELCINVHPSCQNISAFWREHGFAPNPERSVFVNANEQVLVAYWKALHASC